MKKIVSGIRPTGSIHLGNYLGAIKQWKELQEDNNSVFFVADLHQTSTATEATDTMVQLMNLGIKNVAFESEHSSRILDLYHKLCFKVPVGWLNRMTQFKDKSQTEEATLALLSYPVLMAADIFYFGGTHIPIGEDQKQHIEFVRDLADRCGYVKPEPIIGQYPRIMSLNDGRVKMSKSNPVEYSRINVTDKPAIIRDKIMKAKSANSIADGTPEMKNLLQIYKACGGDPNYGTLYNKMKDFKEGLAELIIKELA